MQLKGQILSMASMAYLSVSILKCKLGYTFFESFSGSCVYELPSPSFASENTRYISHFCNIWYLSICYILKNISTSEICADSVL